MLALLLKLVCDRGHVKLVTICQGVAKSGKYPQHFRREPA